jgi:short-subunit dehydrogenase
MRARDARVLLTGAGGGIGRAMASALRDASAAVMGVGRSPAPAAGSDWIQADLTTDEGVARVADAAARWSANVVVHAAGVPAFGAFAHTVTARIDDVIATNLLAPIKLTRALLPALRRRPQARIVFVGSALGRIGLPGFALYGASKAGLHGFAEALRRELADTAVQVQILAPRSTRTGFNGADVEAYNRATGTAMDAPETVAAALLALIESGVAERFIGMPERLGVRLNGLLGARMDRSFVRHRRSVAGAAHEEHLTVTEGNSR